MIFSQLVPFLMVVDAAKAVPCAILPVVTQHRFPEIRNCRLEILVMYLMKGEMGVKLTPEGREMGVKLTPEGRERG